MSIASFPLTLMREKDDRKLQGLLTPSLGFSPNYLSLPIDAVTARNPPT